MPKTPMATAPTGTSRKRLSAPPRLPPLLPPGLAVTVTTPLAVVEVRELVEVLVLVGVRVVLVVISSSKAEVEVVVEPDPEPARWHLLFGAQTYPALQ